MQIDIYGTPTCSYCNAVKEYLTSRDIDFTYFDLTSMNPADAQAILNKTGSRTVPIIFIDTKFIGGYSHLTEIIS